MNGLGIELPLGMMSPHWTEKEKKHYSALVYSVGICLGLGEL